MIAELSPEDEEKVRKFWERWDLEWLKFCGMVGDSGPEKGDDDVDSQPILHENRRVR